LKNTILIVTLFILFGSILQVETRMYIICDFMQLYLGLRIYLAWSGKI